MAYDVDLFVIGAGSGGVRAARMSAAAGAKVAIAEDRFYGGTCVNIGCVPKKLMVMAAQMRGELADMAGFGWTVAPGTHDWATLIANKDREIRRLNDAYEALLRNAGVAVHWGRARIDGPNTVAIASAAGERRVTARYILVATGGAPVRGSEPGAELALVSDDLFALPAMPQRVLVIGGGYIAVEFAGVFAGLGARTTQIYRGSLFLRGFDDDVRRHLAEELRAGGIDLRFGAGATRFERSPSGIVAHLADGTRLEVDAVVQALGRRPNVAGLGLEQAGVKLNKAGAITVDEYSQTTAEGIYAVGDVTDRMNLTPVALAEGMALSRTLFRDQPTKVDYRDIPTAVFSQPALAAVGLTEAQAITQGHVIDVYETRFKPMRHQLSGRQTRIYMKLVVDRRSDRVLGAHMVGADAPEIVQGLGIALKCGATKAQFDATIGIHPTAAEEFVTLRTKRADPPAAAAAD